jgi:hypothetical protein
MLLFKRVFILPAVVLAWSSSAGFAAVLAQYNFDSYSPNSNTNGPATSASAVQPTGATASAFTFAISSDESPGFTDSGFSTSGSNHAFIRTSATGSTVGDATVDDDFFTFSVTADAGQKLNLSTLTFSFAASNNQSNSGASSLTSTAYVYINGMGIGSAAVSAPNTTGTVSFSGESIDLSAAELQGLAAATVKVAFADDVNSFAAVNRIDNVVLNGTVTAVPEPATLALAAMALGGLGLRRRLQI